MQYIQSNLGLGSKLFLVAGFNRSFLAGSITSRIAACLYESNYSTKSDISSCEPFDFNEIVESPTMNYHRMHILIQFRFLSISYNLTLTIYLYYKKIKQ